MFLFVIAILVGIVFLLRILIAFWTETTPTHQSGMVQTRSNKASGVVPFRATARSSKIVTLDRRLKNAARTVNDDAGSQRGYQYLADWPRRLGF